MYIEKSAVVWEKRQNDEVLLGFPACPRNIAIAQCRVVDASDAPRVRSMRQLTFVTAAAAIAFPRHTHDRPTLSSDPTPKLSPSRDCHLVARIPCLKLDPLRPGYTKHTVYDRTRHATIP